MDQATRQALIQSTVLQAGSVPTIRAMRDILALDGVVVTTTTICRDYAQLGYRSPVTCGRKRTGPTTVGLKYFGLPVDVYDQCCRLATRRGEPVTAIIRALVSIGLQHVSAPRKADMKARRSSSEPLSF